MSKIYFENMMIDEFDYVSPTPAISANPQWWKKINKSFNINERSIRACPALSDSFNFGYILYTQIDLSIKKNESSEIFQWSIPSPFIDSSRIFYGSDGGPNLNELNFHSEDQIRGYFIPDSFYNFPVKWHTGFGIKTQKGYSSLISHPFHRNDLPFKIIDAVIDTDVFPAREPFSMFLKKDFEGIIPAGTPMVQVIPFKREDCEMEIVRYNAKDHFKQSLNLNKYFINRYKKTSWQRKNYR